MLGRNAIRFVFFGLLLPMVGCTTFRPDDSADAVAPDDSLVKDAAPESPPPGLAALPDPVVRDVAKSPRGNSPYTVWGEHYEVLPTAAGYESVGRASWYGTKFEGRTTSSGEVYNMYKLTAAHRSLPIPSFVRVTNLDNGRTSIVRVNDRGPFHAERIIDLSYAAAVKLGFEDEGTALVRVETVLPTGSAPPKAKVPYFLRAGRFARFSEAEAAWAELSPMSPGEAFVVRADDAYAVRIGPLATRREVDRWHALLTYREHAPIVVEN